MVLRVGSSTGPHSATVPTLIQPAPRDRPEIDGPLPLLRSTTVNE